MKSKFTALVRRCFDKEVIKKIVFSRPDEGEIKKVSGRLCAHRGKRLLALEYSLPGDTVSHKNVTDGELEEQICELLCTYAQANLLTTFGDVEYKRSRGGEVILGEGRITRRLDGERADFERAIESLDKKKSYILTGNESFLIKLGISDKSGRVHDKKQGKYRQINKFLEHIEEIYKHLPAEGEIKVYDLCCGKSYLSFAVYYYLTAIKGREVYMLGIDLKRDVIDYCNSVAAECGFDKMSFICDDVTKTPENITPDMVISLHACDVATDIVIDRAIALGAKIVLSTPCCHRYLNGKVVASELEFVSRYAHISNKLCEALTDGIRLARLKKNGYEVSALELTDPENTPKNTLIRAIKSEKITEAQLSSYSEEYERILDFVLGDKKEQYLKVK